MESASINTGPEARRQAWLSLLACAPDAVLADLWGRTGLAPVFDWLRAPEIGTVMIRGRAGGTGVPFNLGEMTVTRCSLRLATGQFGHAYVAGRNRHKVEIAALCDALMQDPAQVAMIEASILAPLRAVSAEQTHQRAARAAATRVEFFTLARGED